MKFLLLIVLAASACAAFTANGAFLSTLQRSAKHSTANRIRLNVPKICDLASEESSERRQVFLGKMLDAIQLRNVDDSNTSALTISIRCDNTRKERLEQTQLMHLRRKGFLIVWYPLMLKPWNQYVDLYVVLPGNKGQTAVHLTAGYGRRPNAGILVFIDGSVKRKDVILKAARKFRKMWKSEKINYRSYYISSVRRAGKRYAVLFRYRDQFVKDFKAIYSTTG